MSEDTLNMTIRTMKYEKDATLNTNWNERKFTRLLQDLWYTGDPAGVKRRGGFRTALRYPASEL
jgi:hypothetical protein